MDKVSQGPQRGDQGEGEEGKRVREETGPEGERGGKNEGKGGRKGARKRPRKTLILVLL